MNRLALAALAFAALAAAASDLPESLSKEDFEAGITRVKPRMEACGKRTSAKGKVAIQVTVAPAGNVKAARVKDAPDKALGSCVAGIAKTAVFARSRKGGTHEHSQAF